MRQIAEANPVVRPSSDAMKPIPGTYAAVAILISSGTLVVAALIAGLWLLAQLAFWVGHAL